MPSPAFEELVETFQFLDDWEDRYRTVIDMGRDMPPLDDALKVPATKVDGCASQVWLVPHLDGQGEGAVLTFRGQSDAMIVNGLIAVLRTLYDGRTAAEVLATDARAQMSRLGLDENLSAQRSNGLTAMVERLRQVAADA
ncbi:MAG: SufE family protein [Paracoccaceae bacterium]